MNRIWNALRYGDFETRKSIGSVILFCVIGIVLIIVSGVTGTFTFFILGMLSGVVALIISQTFTLVDDDYVAETGKDGKKESVRSVSVMKNGVSSSSKTNNKQNEKIQNEDKKDSSSSERALEELKRKQEELVATELLEANQKELKRLKRKYHVKKDHRPIIIDNSVSYSIKECPAFIWRVRNNIYFLLLEKQPRRIRISRDLIQHVDYVPNVRANRQNEYLNFKKQGMITSVFESYLPDYFDSKASDSNLKHKHLYEIAPDIQISNRSIATVMDLLYLNFMPDDKLTQSDKVNRFFKRLYAANIMYKDRAYSITEYKEMVEKILEEMCYMELPFQEFQNTLDNMVKARFISQEYADHYMDVRSRVSKKK